VDVTTNNRGFNPPFKIGDVYYRPISAPRQTTITCPICDGKLYITIILGSGEQLQVECDGCDTGLNRPKGTLTEWNQDPATEFFEIASITSFHNGSWGVMSSSGSTCDFSNLETFEVDALRIATEQSKEVYERNMAIRLHRKRETKKAGWSIQYHRQCIKDAERTIQWHQSKIATKSNESPQK
jgi:hypothetical protein